MKEGDGCMFKVASWCYDAVTKETECSEGVFQIYDLDTNAPIPALQRSLYYDEKDRKEIEEVMAVAESEAIPYTKEFKITTAKGNQKWIRSIGVPYVKDGHCIRIDGTIQDITDSYGAVEQTNKQKKIMEMKSIMHEVLKMLFFI